MKQINEVPKCAAGRMRLLGCLMRQAPLRQACMYAQWRSGRRALYCSNPGGEPHVLIECVQAFVSGAHSLPCSCSLIHSWSPKLCLCCHVFFPFATVPPPTVTYVGRLALPPGQNCICNCQSDLKRVYSAATWAECSKHHSYGGRQGGPERHLKGGGLRLSQAGRKAAGEQKAKEGKLSRPQLGSREGSLTCIERARACGCCCHPRQTRQKDFQGLGQLTTTQWHARCGCEPMARRARPRCLKWRRRTVGCNRLEQQQEEPGNQIGWMKHSPAAARPAMRSGGAGRSLPACLPAVARCDLAHSKGLRAGHGGATTAAGGAGGTSSFLHILCRGPGPPGGCRRAWRPPALIAARRTHAVRVACRRRCPTRTPRPLQAHEGRQRPAG